MSATLILVNFHSAALTERAIASARSSTSAELEVVVVDNSLSPDEANRLRSFDIDCLIVAESNLGYGGGVNRALGSVHGEYAIMCNPDVVFASGAIDLLLEPLVDPGIALTGPSFFWDDAMEWHLPPPETMEFLEQLTRNLTLRIPAKLRRPSRRLLERRLDFWRASSPRSERVLSGAVMALRARDLAAYRFDERYPLYFEEIDLMRRLRRAGRDLVRVPAARVRHLWGQSAARNPRSAALFDLSRRRFHQRWHGRIGSEILSLTRTEPDERCAAPELSRPSIAIPDGDHLVELGNGRDFLMAAGKFVSGGSTKLPQEVLRSCALDRLCCRVVDLSKRSTVQSWALRAVLQDAKRLH